MRIVMAESWKLTLPCTRAEAETINQDMGELALLEPPPALMTSELGEDDPSVWQLHAYFEGKPSRKTIARLQAMVPSSAGVKAVLERLPDEDWVSLSQQGLEPVVAGRFHVRNRADDAVVPGLVPLLIPAGRAFGTGQHQTTSGCLAMLDRCRQVGERFGNSADIGTGTGLLAFAALHLWPRSFATASDIDPAAVEVSAQNAALNGINLGQGRGALALCVAAGVDHPLIEARAPYDLLIANILAGPLIELAPSLSAVLGDGGTLILAGLLDEQADAVARAYRAQGLRLVDRIEAGDTNGRDWPTLRFRKRPAIGWKRPLRLVQGANGEAPGFGSW
ncbi:MAG: 50S ribosomal protein L11 methyltransferase [Sphingobium sp.]|nr:50S ribosomal protein L11 methyltransferase [Sphingobium sp.]MBP6111270.1 50S ribosomal protein L11 methyltransferase [Sphingobium sp.]MBP8670859.1 50S ribosomal protein L11 methyltransferase [Sphingobium sp.]MBP9156714.1 50S ribosomal protein L11 methyltransferase [Sphingobium sp.]MCC6483132.1 50S ribosomal protein L11 methyltransferase [Sphingomonadaceae bacterium]